MLVGEKVRLRAVEVYDYPSMARWLNDEGIMLYWGRSGNTMSLDEVQRAEEADAARATSKKYVIETVDGVAIGQIDYYDLNWQVRSASVSILIGDPAFWGGGFGTDAMRVLLRYMFMQMGLHRVSLNVHESNERARRSYEKNGFVSEGVMRDWAYFDGHWTDGVLMSVLADEFRQILDN